jgi:hypothetical protein
MCCFIQGRRLYSYNFACISSDFNLKLYYGLGQAQKCGREKPVNGMPTL